MPSLSSVVVGVLGLAVSASAGQEPVVAPRPPEKVRLAYHFQEGDVLRMVVEKSSHLLAVKGKARQEQSNRSVSHCRYTVASVSAEETATLRYRIDHAKMQFRFGDQPPVTFDSEDDVTPTLFKNVRKVLGVDFLELTIKPDGSVVAVRQLVRSDESASKPASGEESSHHKAMVVLPRLPEEPIRVGESWEQISTTGVKVGRGLTGRLTKEVEILHSYTLESVAAGVAVISYKTAPLARSSRPGVRVQLAKQTASGTIRFDIAKGRLLKRTRNVDTLTIGWQGPDSSLTTTAHRVERFVPPQRQASAQK